VIRQDQRHARRELFRIVDMTGSHQRSLIDWTAGTLSEEPRKVVARTVTAKASSSFLDVVEGRIPKGHLVVAAHVRSSAEHRTHGTSIAMVELMETEVPFEDLR
jgi:hypothetical protein